ncbi:hypothetical protein FKM95_000054 [Candidatus Tremblaya phenacola]|nr:hypothetical protein FKM95_000054 [Candidatus Tremblaya phenacola]
MDIYGMIYGYIECYTHRPSQRKLNGTFPSSRIQLQRTNKYILTV